MNELHYEEREPNQDRALFTSAELTIKDNIVIEDDEKDPLTKNIKPPTFMIQTNSADTYTFFLD